jgi:hypothetical protein
MISYEDQKKFIHKYEYYLSLFNTLLSFFRNETLNPFNHDLFTVFIELLYETIGRKIISKKISNICHDIITFEMFSILFKTIHINTVLYYSKEENNDFFDLIQTEFNIYMNNLYGMIFRSSISNEESKMIHIDYIMRYEYSIYSLDYIFFEELYEYMVIESEVPINHINIINIIYHNQDNIEDNNEFVEEDDIYS